MNGDESKIRKLLQEKLKESEIGEIIKAVQGNNEYSDSQLKQLFKESGLLDKISLNFINSFQEPDLSFDNVESTIPSISINIIKGRAFLHQPDINENVNTSLSLHLLWRNDKFSSPKSSDPFSLLQISDKFHLVLIRTDSTNVNTLIGTCNLEWRTALFTKFTRVIEVKDIFNTQLTVGLVELIVSCQGVQLQKDEVEFQIRKESQSLIESDRLFFTYSKRWWNDFLFIRPSSFSDRLVKIFATREGDNRRECVTNFIHPLKSEFIETPRHAARFVSLIPYEKTQGIGEGKQDVWRDTHTFLTVGKGDAQDHAVLLCNLLLGFHLDAYVVCGLDKKSNAHLWVLTIEIDGSVTFWDSLTGNRYKRPRKSVINNQDDKVNEKWYPYRTIGCLFNHKSFYANIQVSDSTDTCDFNLQNDKLWKQMSNDALNSIKTDFTMYPFKPTNLAESGFVSGTDLENALKSRIVQYRQDHGFKGSILFTEDLEMRSLLTQQLWKYETRKILDIIDDEYFQTGIKLLIPDGHTFKGYPANFNNHDIDGIFNSFLKSSVCREIMLTRGDHVRFCVGAKSFGYVENVGSCWIMIAVRYRKIE